MAAEDRVKTIVPRARSTLDSHPEVKQEELHRFFLLLANTTSQASSFAAYDWTSSVLGLVKFLPYDT